LHSVFKNSKNCKGIYYLLSVFTYDLTVHSNTVTHSKLNTLRTSDMTRYRFYLYDNKQWSDISASIIPNSVQGKTLIVVYNQSKT